MSTLRQILPILIVSFIFVLAGCQTVPKDILKLSPESLEQRQLQTRRFEGISESDLLSASAGVIQDLGFNIDESETKLGVIVGSKARSAVNPGQVIAAVLMIALSGDPQHIDKEQKLRISLVVRPSLEHKENNYLVRVTFQRSIWNTAGQITNNEGIDDPKIYQEFLIQPTKIRHCAPSFLLCKTWGL